MVLVHRCFQRIFPYIESVSVSKFHYDQRLTIAERRIYIESVLLSEDPDDPEIQVVNIHEA